MNRLDSCASPRPYSGFERQFLSFIDRGELRYPRNRLTGEPLGLMERAASRTAHIEWVMASGKASLYSFAIYHQRYVAEFEPPYNVAHVELEEGPCLISTVLTDTPRLLEIGMPLRARFEPGGRLVFVPA